MISWEKTTILFVGGPVHQRVVYFVWGFMQANVHMENQWSSFVSMHASGQRRDEKDWGEQIAIIYRHKTPKHQANDV